MCIIHDIKQWDFSSVALCGKSLKVRLSDKVRQLLYNSSPVCCHIATGYRYASSTSRKQSLVIFLIYMLMNHLSNSYFKVELFTQIFRMKNLQSSIALVSLVLLILLCALCETTPYRVDPTVGWCASSTRFGKWRSSTNTKKEPQCCQIKDTRVESVQGRIGSEWKPKMIVFQI